MRKQGKSKLGDTTPTHKISSNEPKLPSEMDIEKGKQSDGDISSGSDSDNEDDFDMSKSRS